jgi:hypothetical protein
MPQTQVVLCEAVRQGHWHLARQVEEVAVARTKEQR